MYKLPSNTVPFEHPGEHTMYRMRSIHFEEPFNDVSTVAETQVELIERLESFLARLTLYADSKGLAHLCGAKNGSQVTNSVGRQISDSPMKKVELSTFPTSKRGYQGTFEIVCQASNSLPLSVLVLPALIRMFSSQAGLKLCLYKHSSLLLSTTTHSDRVMSFFDTLKDGLPACTSNNNSNSVSLVIRVIASELKPETKADTELEFFVHDFGNKVMARTGSSCLSGEAVLIQCALRIMGFSPSTSEVEKMLAFSQSANRFLSDGSKDDWPGILARYFYDGSPFSQSVAALKAL